MRRQGNFFQMKNERKTLKKATNEIEVSNFEKDFKTIVIKMLTELGKRIDEHSEDLNKEKI